VAVELYAQIFHHEGALDRLEGFCSRHGQAFYHLPLSSKKICLLLEDWVVPLTYPLGSDARVRPLMAGEVVHWKIEGKNYE
jgi:dihydroorotase